MQVVNIKELKARLSAYLRQVRTGETFLVTDRQVVIARLGPVEQAAGAPPAGDTLSKLVTLGARPPLRQRRPSDYARPGTGSGLETSQIDALMAWSRGESDADGPG